MLSSFRDIFTIIKTAFREWISKDPFKESAVIAYYAIFSIPGLLIVIVAIAGHFFGSQVVTAHLHDQIVDTMGKDIATQIQLMLVRSDEAEKSILATLIGLITIFIGATGVFTQFQSAINTIWGVTADKSKSGVWKFFKARAFSFGIVVSIAFMLMVSLVVSTMISAFSNWISRLFSDELVVLFQLMNAIISLSILTFMFALVFKVIPDAKIKWKHVWIGSFVTAFLFELGKFGLGYYFGAANPGTGYGAAGSVILILLWVSYSSMIVFYGAEFTRAYADKVTGTVGPNENAIIDDTIHEHK